MNSMLHTASVGHMCIALLRNLSLAPSPLSLSSAPHVCDTSLPSSRCSQSQIKQHMHALGAERHDCWRSGKGCLASARARCWRGLEEGPS